MNKKIEFALSMLFFWVKGSVEVDTRMVRVNIKNTVLGIIPAGQDNQTIPLKNVSASSISSSYKIKPMLIGLVLIFIGFGSFGSSFMMALLLMLIGVGILGSGIQTVLIIQRAGADYYIRVPFYEKMKMIELKDVIDEMLIQDTDKTDMGLYFDKK